MAWGGGNYITMNKILPGVYANIKTSGGIGTSISDRGLVGIGLEGLTWGPDATVFTLTASEFYNDSEKYFGVGAMDDSMKGIRDIFKYGRIGYFYKLGTATKASCTYGAAKYGGTFGNNLKVVISANVDDITKFDVETLIGTKIIATAIAVEDTDDLEDNDYVIWNSAVSLATGTVSFTGGVDGTADATAYTAFMSAIELYEELNAIGCVSTTANIVTAFVAFIKRLVYDRGRTVQGVVYGNSANDENIVNVKNSANLVYWATGAIGGCAVNKSMTGKTYDGDFTISADYTQAQLETAITNGEWTLHKVGDQLKVLKDINSLTTFTAEKGKDLAINQVMRATNAFLYSVKQSFTITDLGNTVNDVSGRASVQSRIIDVGTALLDMGAFSEFNGDDVTVSAVVGDSSAIAVTAIITPALAMDKMYLNLVVS